MAKKRSKKSKVNVYKLDGTVKKTVSLPNNFKSQVREDIIKKSVRIAQSNRRQPYGPSPLAGMQHPVSTWGKGRGVARVQRISQGRRGAESPNNVGGRRAHPPTVEKVWRKKINKKEKRIGFLSALAACRDEDMVRERGHRFFKDVTLPVIVVDEIEEISATQEIIEILDSIGVGEDLERAKKGKTIRRGKGKMRGRRYKTPRSILLVVSKRGGVEKGVRNLLGVDLVQVRELNTEHLAPGADPGRLLAISESGLKELAKR